MTSRMLTKAHCMIGSGERLCSPWTEGGGGGRRVDRGDQRFSIDYVMKMEFSFVTVFVAQLTVLYLPSRSAASSHYTQLALTFLRYG